MRLAAVALLVMISAMASAQAPDPLQSAGWYAGFGLSDFVYDDELPADFRFDDTVTAVRFFGGYKWNANWGVELSYLDTTLFDDNADGMDFILGPFTSVYAPDIAALTVRPMAYLPTSWGVLFGGLGLFQGDRTRQSSGSSLSMGLVPGDLMESDSGATFLLGTEWPIGSLKLRAEYEWWDLDRANGSSLGLGLSYRF